MELYYLHCIVHAKQISRVLLTDNVSEDALRVA